MPGIAVQRGEPHHLKHEQRKQVGARAERARHQPLHQLQRRQHPRVVQRRQVRQLLHAAAQGPPHAQQRPDDVRRNRPPGETDAQIVQRIQANVQRARHVLAGHRDHRQRGPHLGPVQRGLRVLQHGIAGPRGAIRVHQLRAHLHGRLVQRQGQRVVGLPRLLRQVLDAQVNLLARDGKCPGYQRPLRCLIVGARAVERGGGPRLNGLRGGKMPGDLKNPIRAVVWPRIGQQVRRHAGVQRLALRQRRQTVRRRLDAVVREHELGVHRRRQLGCRAHLHPRLADGRHQPAMHHRHQIRRDIRHRAIRHTGERRQRKPVPQACRHLDRPLRAGREAQQLAGQQLHDVVRHLNRRNVVELPMPRAAPAVPTQQAALGQMFQKLVDKKRVATRLFVQQLRERLALRARRGRGIGNQLGDVRDLQRTQRNGSCSKPALRKRMEQLAHGMGGAYLTDAPSQHHDQVAHVRVRHQRFQQVQRGEIRPLHVIQEQRDRVVRRADCAHEPTQQVAQPVLRGGTVERRNRRLRTQQQLQIGHDGQNRAAQIAHRVAQPRLPHGELILV